MYFDKALTIAFIAAFVNIIFSILMPCLLKNTNRRSLTREMKITFLVHRHVLIASSIATAIMVYLAVKLEPGIQKSIPELLSQFSQE